MSLLTRRTHRLLPHLHAGTNAIAPIRFDLNRIFDNFFMDLDSPSSGLDKPDTVKWCPRLAVSETDNEFKVRAELAGVNEGDIHIEIKDNTLTIKGEKKWDKKEDSESYHHIETHWGQFERSLPFVQEIDSEKVIASFSNGVLDIRLAKLEPQKSLARKICINSAS